MYELANSASVQIKMRQTVPFTPGRRRKFEKLLRRHGSHFSDHVPEETPRCAQWTSNGRVSHCRRHVLVIDCALLLRRLVRDDVEHQRDGVLVGRRCDIMRRPAGERSVAIGQMIVHVPLPVLRSDLLLVHRVMEVVLVVPRWRHWRRNALRRVEEWSAVFSWRDAGRVGRDCAFVAARRQQSALIRQQRLIHERSHRSRWLHDERRERGIWWTADGHHCFVAVEDARRRVVVGRMELKCEANDRSMSPISLLLC